MRLAFTIIISAFGLILLNQGYPISELNQPTIKLIAFFRIFYGLIILIRLIRGWKAIPLMQGWENTKKYRIVYIFWIGNSLFLILGFLTAVTTIINYFLCYFVWRKQKEYSVEDLLFRLVAFHLLFFDSGNLFSIDFLIGIHYSLISCQPVFLNFFILNVLLSFFSAGFEKWFSDTWRKGLGFYYFIAIPHLVHSKFKFLRTKKNICVLLNWLTMIIESSCLFSLVHSDLNMLCVIGLLLF